MTLLETPADQTSSSAARSAEGQEGTVSFVRIDFLRFTEDEKCQITLRMVSSSSLTLPAVASMMRGTQWKSIALTGTSAALTLELPRSTNRATATSAALAALGALLAALGPLLAASLPHGTTK